MRTITEVTGMSLKAVRDILPGLKKEATEALGTTLEGSLRETITVEQTKALTEAATPAITERLTTELTESLKAQMTSEGKPADEIELMLPEAVTAAVAAAIPAEVEKEISGKLSGAVDAEVKKQLAPAIQEQTKGAIEAKIGENRKLEGEKLALFMTVLEMTEGKKGNIKRVVVMAPNEGEKAPSGLVEKDGKFFAIEFFPEAGNRAPSRDDRDSRDGGRGGRGGRDGKGRGDKRGGPDGAGRGRDGGGAGFGGDRRPPRDSNGPTPNGVVIGARRADTGGPAIITSGAEGAPRTPRPPREVREPRAPRTPRPPREPRVEVKPNGIVIGAGGKLMLKSEMPVTATAVENVGTAPTEVAST